LPLPLTFDRSLLLLILPVRTLLLQPHFSSFVLHHLSSPQLLSFIIFFFILSGSAPVVFFFLCLSCSAGDAGCGLEAEMFARESRPGG
jgi:hypothetical protein